MAGDEFSELLGQLKERSGLSYGVLGKRLHTSTSTLHRYVNGDAVPTDYAPVERFARACKASPEELVELHRRWVLADARRGQKADGDSPSVSALASASDLPAASALASASASPAASGSAVGSESAADVAVGGDVLGSGPEGERAGAPDAPVARRRRTVVLAGAAVAAAVVSAALVVNLVPGKSDDGEGRKQSVGAAAESVDQSPGASASGDAKGRSASPSASRSGTPTASSSASRSAGAGAAQDSGAEESGSAPTVAVNPYKWDSPCSQHYLVDRKPEQVPPPPSESDARGWVSALGGVAAGQQMLALTVQGTGKATVVLEELHVRVVEKSAPLAWNDFEMGVGCGGGVETTSFAVNLDAGRPATSPKAGQRDFPYKVSESDPEVFYIFADARAHNVSWYLELDWSSGTKQGTVRVDNKGQPFRTSGNVGRPAYNYPLGDSEWGRNEYEPDIPG
ncbi:helix-turn-helix transcriptional regulator [Streptomyces phaeochromogenes]|uniref:helix-turn-helix domain-containing protein n=1 Tax=Streptomyces phaeochromogenes TaxID=1923 RepID=UPI002DDC3CB4|nr:helix-turn-helix transcriptional regulator [Streptomyces phaeochromogenes]WRZ31500.1 helix-turn-helix domain-containing protein [Streptomyces phaeochromogenes]